jgi:PAS domain S-box-containing protein
MLRIYACLTGQHDLRLVFLAVLICIVACSISVKLFVRANATEKDWALSWLFGAATVFGTGVWATHFIAELAYEPGFPIGYDAGLTALSFVAAIGAVWLGMFVAHRYAAPVPGGAMLGAGIATMHYIGMAALRAPAQLHWDAGYVLASIAIAMTLAAAAMRVLLWGPALRVRLMAALLLVLAIVGLHFTAMAAVTLVPNPLIAVPVHAVTPTVLAVLIATVTVLIGGLGLLGLTSDLALLAKRPLYVTAFSIFVVAPFMILTATFFYLQEQANDNSKNWVMHTYEVAEAIQILSNQIKDADIGLREYTSTGEDEYLVPYHDALKNSSGVDVVSPQMEPNHSVDEEIIILRTLTQDNPVQQKHLDEMNINMNELLEYWAAAIQMRHALGTAAAPQFDIRRGSQLMDKVRRLTSAMMVEENRLLSLRIKASADSTRQVDILTYCGIVFFYIVLVLSVWFYQRNRWQSDIIQKKLIENLEKSNEEIKASTKKFTESEMHHQQLVDGVQDYAIYWLDLEGNVESWNSGAERIKGYVSKEIIGQHFSRFYTEEDQKKGLPQKALDTALTSGKFEGEGWRVRKDGSKFWANVTMSTIHSQQGTITGFAKVTNDITERKQFEQALKTSEETFRAAMDYAPIGMALGDLDGRWLKVNKALCDLLGYEQDELLARDFQSTTHPDDLETELEHVRKLLAGDIKTYQLEKTYYHKSGRNIWVLLSASLVRKADGKPNYLVKQVQDITERKEMERMKSEFISIVSHELRTPLTSIRGSLGLMVGTMTKDLPEKANQLINIAHKNSDRLILLINDMLDIDKIASGQMRFDIKEEALSPLIRQAVETNQPYADKFGVSITMLPVDIELHVHVDSARLSQVLANLLSNAAKFSNQADKIEISAMLSGKNVRISVKDHGPGIAEEFRTRIFIKFSQADSSATRVKGGTGLGLHISRQIIENMGGQIGFDTEIGKGSTFWIEFPIAVNHEDASPSSSQNGSKASLLHYRERRSDSPVVLHVEDDLDLSHVLATALQGKVDIITTTTLKHAERLLKVQTFDMIVLDIGLPDGSGLSLLEKLPELTDPSTPVMILSANEMPKEVQLKVAASMVKSRVLETKIVETMLQLLSNRLLASSGAFCAITGESAA